LASSSLPNAIIIGAQRCGTTLLHHVLDAHESVYVPKRRKEVHYFDQYYDRGPDWYASFFPSEEEATPFKIIAEVTPDYLYAPNVAERLEKFNPDIKLILSLRDPVDRFVSHYHHWQRITGDRMGLDTFFNSIDEAKLRGRYFEQMEHFLERFPKSNFHIMIFEEWTKDPSAHLRQLGDFLNLPNDWSANAINKLFENEVNASYQTRLPALYRLLAKTAKHLRALDADRFIEPIKSLPIVRFLKKPIDNTDIKPDLMAKLTSFYQDDTQHIETFLGRNIPAWSHEA